MIPALEKIQLGKGTQVLVLCPTRELAQQVAEDTEALAKGTRIRSQAIFGVATITSSPRVSASICAL